MGANQLTELIFVVEQAPEGGYIARALGESIFTEGDSLEELRQNVREATECHFDEGQQPKIIRLHFVREEVLLPTPA
jgi:predicted RNase H-like HicB family nuclease